MRGSGGGGARQEKGRVQGEEAQAWLGSRQVPRVSSSIDPPTTPPALALISPCLFLLYLCCSRYNVLFSMSLISGRITEALPVTPFGYGVQLVPQRAPGHLQYAIRLFNHSPGVTTAVFISIIDVSSEVLGLADLLPRQGAFPLDTDQPTCWYGSESSS